MLCEGEPFDKKVPPHAPLRKLPRIGMLKFNVTALGVDLRAFLLLKNVNIYVC